PCNSGQPVRRGHTGAERSRPVLVASAAASRHLPRATVPCGPTASSVRPSQVRTLTPLGRPFGEQVTSCRAGGSHLLCSEAEVSLVAVILTFRVVSLSAKAPGPPWLG